MNKSIAFAATATLAFASASFMPAAAMAAGEVNVYSYRQPVLLKPLLDAFTKETGIEVEVAGPVTGTGQRRAQTRDQVSRHPDLLPRTRRISDPARNARRRTGSRR